MANVIITGSVCGIGLVMAKEFLKKGRNMTISGRAKIPSAELEKEIGGLIFTIRSWFLFYLQTKTQKAPLL